MNKIKIQSTVYCDDRFTKEFWDHFTKEKKHFDLWLLDIKDELNNLTLQSNK